VLADFEQVVFDREVPNAVGRLLDLEVLFLPSRAAVEGQAPARSIRGPATLRNRSVQRKAHRRGARTDVGIVL